MRRLLAGALVGVLLGQAVAAGHAGAGGHGYDSVVDVTFPVAGPVTYGDDYHAHRGGGTRRHQATDIFAPKLALVFAAAGGRICRITGIDEAVPAHGYQISVCGDDARTYHYVHLNNDTPGTDDGAGGARWAYAPGIGADQRVTRGQWLGFVGDSGNAEETAPHLHLEIEDERLNDARIAQPPYDPVRMNPFPSLAAAQAEGDVAGGLLREGDRGQAVVDWQRQLGLVGARVAVDGVFGPQTRSATVELQQTQGVAVDGVVGVETRDALSRSLAAARASPAVGPAAGSTFPGRLLRLETPLLRGDDVRAWQQRMRERAWDIAVDGIYGPRSEDVCRRFQRQQGLIVDGIVGPRTWGAAFAAEV